MASAKSAAAKAAEKETTAAGANPDAAPAPAETAAIDVAAGTGRPVAPARTVAPLAIASWRARESGVFFNTHEVVPEVGTPIEALSDRNYWSNIAQKLRPGDTLIVFPRDGRWYGEFLVWDAGQNWAHVSPMGLMERPEFAPLEGVESDFEIARDPIDGIVVQRRSTGAKVRGNFPNHAEAQKWIIEHQQALRT